MANAAQSEPRPFGAVVELRGEIDLANAGDISVELCEMIARQGRDLVIDVSAVPFIDSSAIAMMVHVHQHATVSGSMVTWRGLQPAPMRALSVLGLDSALNIDGSAQPD